MTKDSVGINVKKRLLKAKAHAKTEIDIILAEPLPTKMFLYEHLRKYVLAKYMLDEEVCPTDIINEIMLISLEKAIRTDRALIMEYERGGSCESTTPVITKRILLFMTLQQELNIKLVPQEMAQIISIEDLVNLIWQAKGKHSSPIPQIKL